MSNLLNFPLDDFVYSIAKIFRSGSTSDVNYILEKSRESLRFKSVILPGIVAKAICKNDIDYAKKDGEMIRHAHIVREFAAEGIPISELVLLDVANIYLSEDACLLPAAYELSDKGNILDEMDVYFTSISLKTNYTLLIPALAALPANKLMPWLNERDDGTIFQKICRVSPDSKILMRMAEGHLLGSKLEDELGL